jgi:cobalt-zinc-cadmium efflux system membrane fusion protein
MIASMMHARRQGATFAWAAAALLGVAACSGHAAGTADGQQLPRVVEVSDSALITVLDPNQFPMVTASALDVTDGLSGTCVVSPDVNRTVPVNALGGGRVVQLDVRLGDQVRQGQPLVVINSPDLSGALADYQKARSDEILARRQLDRQRLLLDHGAAARKDVEAAENDEEKALVDLRTGAAHVHTLGGDTSQTVPYIELTAPVSGTIIEQNVTPASGVKSPDNAPNLLTIADLSHVWVLCDVYEDDLARVRVGEQARVRLVAYPDRALTGSVGNISQVLDPTTRTAKVRVEIDNPDAIMKVGMFATAELASRIRQRRIVLPSTALLRIHDADWVFVKTGAKAFRRVPVEAGAAMQGGGGSAAEMQIVQSGVSAGDQVVKDALRFSQAMEHH